MQEGGKHAFERSFSRGDVVFEENEPGEVLYVIQSGAIELSRRGPGGGSDSRPWGRATSWGR